MTKNKEVVSWTIDKNIIEKINKEAKKSDRSRSFIANKYLQEALKWKFQKNNLTNYRN